MSAPTNTARRIFLGLLLAAAAGAALAAPSHSPSPSPRPNPDGPDALTLVAEAELPGTIAWIIIDLDTGEALEGGNVDEPLPPASVAKAPTAVFALAALGPDHRFETRLVASGVLEDGVLTGDLILQGGGDPETDTESLDLLTFHAAEAGLKRVDGRFLVDDALLPAIEQIDATQPEIAAYNPAVAGINLNYNRVFAEWGRTGGRMEMKVEARARGASPATGAIQVEIAEAVTDGAFDYLGGDDRENWRVARKALGEKGGRWLPVRRPAAYAGDVMRTLAARAGFELPAVEPGPAPMMANVLARVESRPLADILTDMLTYSTNLTAEAVGVAAARALGGAPATLGASAAAMNDWVAEFAGFPPGDAGFQLVNHSGLSPDSRVSVRRFAEFLLAAERRGFPALDGGRAAKLKGLMPQRNFLDEGTTPPPVAASLRAKTGTLNFVSALAGYIEPEHGRRFAFAI
ncbi:MAG: D-alanyl-D-alanine carboxypeptidase/D-alanyl-D-alanine-endopeptidase, partial [Paracoccaceae bacterium]